MEATDGSAPWSTFVNLTAAGGAPAQYFADTQRIGYGTTGFETFTIDVPDRFRGKTATLRFEASGGTVYLDNVFFKSQHLLLGNPTEARATNTPVPNLYFNNYLLEKPQYTSSFNGDSHIPNWSAWQLNDNWSGSDRPSDDPFFRDPNVNALNFVSAKKTDYDRPLSEIPGTIQADNKPYKLAPGHLVPNADRSRNLKDATSTFATSNIVPQHGTHNNSIWKSLESFANDLTAEKSREIYIYAGGAGEKSEKLNINVISDPTYSSYSIQVPEHLWKVILVLDRPGLGINEITTQNAKAFAVWTENTLPEPGSAPYTPWYNGGMQIMPVRALEDPLNRDANNQARGITYNFFSNLPEVISQQLKVTLPTIPTRNPKSAFLLASTTTSNENTLLASANTTVWHDGFEEDGTLEIGTLANLSTLQIGSSEICESQGSTFEKSTAQIAPSQVGTRQSGQTNTSSTQINTLKIRPIKTDQTQYSTSEICTPEINLLHEKLIKDSTSEVCTAQINSIQLITAVDVQTRKVSFSSSVASEQFFSFNPRHTPTSNLIALNSTAVSLWQSFFPKFDLTLEVRDLPTGQLAEAQLTGFDANGRPNAGTLLLDYNGNDLGWF
jgi:large repetitive protein